MLVSAEDPAVVFGIQLATLQHLLVCFYLLWLLFLVLKQLPLQPSRLNPGTTTSTCRTSLQLTCPPATPSGRCDERPQAGAGATLVLEGWELTQVLKDKTKLPHLKTVAFLLL